MVGTQRYWDGTDWTDDVAPLPVSAPARVDTWQGIRIVGFGILAAIGVLVVLSRILT